MGNRLEVNELLENILGSENVYAQSPEAIEMQYPAIKYRIENSNVKFASNSPHITRSQYTVTLIDYDIDSEFVDKLHGLSYCSMNRYYPKNGLHHWVFTLYY